MSSVGHAAGGAGGCVTLPEPTAGGRDGSPDGLS